MTEDLSSKNGNKYICVWTVPVGVKPAVRVEINDEKISAQKLFEIGCNALELSRGSRRFFGLFRGTTNPTRKYGPQDQIYLPCKATISIQRWSFDLKLETIVIRTDPVAFRLIASHIVSDLEKGKIKVDKEKMEELKDLHDPEFPCHKMFVDAVRELPFYIQTSFLDVEIMKDAKIVNTILEAESKVDIVCTQRKLMLISEDVELGIPWSKIRHFEEIRVTKRFYFEVVISGKKFARVEIQTPQGVLLLQTMEGFIDAMRTRIDHQAFRQPKWISDPTTTRMSWKEIKKEMRGKREPEEEVVERFDDICVESSDSEEDD